LKERWTMSTSTLVRSAFSLLVGVMASPQLATATQGDCSQPVSAGERPVASDCLYILGVAVGADSCTPEVCVCDPTGDGATTATDALSCLKVAVGETTAILQCPCPATTTTTMPSTANCTNNGICNDGDDCVCSDCDDDLFCSDPSNCKDDGVCKTFVEGCVCADCATEPECLYN